MTKLLEKAQDYFQVDKRSETQLEYEELCRKLASTRPGDHFELHSDDESCSVPFDGELKLLD